MKRAHKISISLCGGLLSGLGSVFVTTAGPQALASKPLCTAEFLSGPCEDLTRQPLDLRRNAKEADGVIFNYFRALNPKYSHEVRDFGEKTTPKLHSHTLQIAEDVRESALKFVTKGLPPDKISAENRAFAERLRTVRFRIRKNFSLECYETADPGVPNANYNPLEHTITICASSTRVTSQWIAATVAHELGHVISTCAMASSLIRFKEPNDAVDQCIFDKDVGGERAEDEEENWGARSVGYESEPRTYAVNHEPESMKEFIRCDGVEVLPGSQIPNPSAYKKFNLCIDKKNANAYENWIAQSALKLEVMPKKMSSKWKALVDEAKATTSLRCFRKSEEQFADSFGGFVYSEWASAKKMSAEKFKLALNDLALIRCRERLTGEISLNRTLYTTPSERIEMIAHNPNTAKLLQCTLPSTSDCRLDENTFETTTESPPLLKQSPPRVVK